MNLPNLIIIGSTKAATSSLFTYLSHSSDVFPSPKKELRYFNHVYYGRTLAPIEEYSRNFAGHSYEKYLMEATPEYFHNGKIVAKQISGSLDHPKLILILRNPKDRFISYFNHLKKTLSLDVDYPIEDYFKYCVENLNYNPVEDDYTNIKRGLKDGLYHQLLTQWFDHKDLDIKVMFFENLTSNPKKEIGAICEWLKIDDSFLETISLEAQNKSVLPKNRLLHKMTYKVFFLFEEFFRKNSKAKEFLRDLYYKINTRKKESFNSFEEEIDRFYIEENLKLKAFLVDKYPFLELPQWLRN